MSKSLRKQARDDKVALEKSLENAKRRQWALRLLKKGKKSLRTIAHNKCGLVSTPDPRGATHAFADDASGGPVSRATPLRQCVCARRNPGVTSVADGVFGAVARVLSRSTCKKSRAGSARIVRALHVRDRGV